MSSFLPFPYTDLSPSESYIDAAPTLHLIAYSVNQKGRSEPTVLEDIAINEAEKRTGTCLFVSHTLRTFILPSCVFFLSLSPLFFSFRFVLHFAVIFFIFFSILLPIRRSFCFVLLCFLSFTLPLRWNTIATHHLSMWHHCQCHLQLCPSPVVCYRQCFICEMRSFARTTMDECH